MDRVDVAAALAAPTYSIRVVPGVKDKLVASEHHDTLVELCRQQHEVIEAYWKREGSDIHDIYHDETTATATYDALTLRDELNALAAVLALWPDGGE